MLQQRPDSPTSPFSKAADHMVLNHGIKSATLKLYYEHFNRSVLKSLQDNYLSADIYSTFLQWTAINSELQIASPLNQLTETNIGIVVCPFF